MPRRFLAYLLASSGLIILDQVVKLWSRHAADGAEGRIFYPLWPGVFELKLIYNHGVAFGMFQGGGVFLTPIAIVITVVSAVVVWRMKEEGIALVAMLSLLSAGAIGNLIDRLWMGKVTDMFWIRLIDFPVFNIADICITVAGAMLVISALKDSISSKKSEALEPSAAEETSQEPEAQVEVTGPISEETSSPSTE